MNIYSHFSTNEAKTFVESDGGLKNLIKELNHAYGVSVGSVYKQRISLVYPNGIPLGSVCTFSKESRNGESEKTYAFSGEFISKERGRGHDLYTRDSFKIKNLLKLIEKDRNGASFDGTRMDFSRIKERFDGVPRDLYEGVNDSFDTRYAKSIELNRLTSIAMLKYFFDKEMVTDATTIKQLEEYYKRYKDWLSNTAKTNEVLKRFYDYKCYYIMAHRNMPPLVGTLNFVPKTNNDGYGIFLHDNMKGYSSIDAIAEDYPDLVVTYKMWLIQYENNPSRRLTDVESEPYDVTRMLPFHNTFNEVMDVLTGSGNINGLCSHSNFRYLLTPVVGDNNHA
jgi:hypothetical protein